MSSDQSSNVTATADLHPPIIPQNHHNHHEINNNLNTNEIIDVSSSTVNKSNIQCPSTIQLFKKFNNDDLNFIVDNVKSDSSSLLFTNNDNGKDNENFIIDQHENEEDEIIDKEIINKFSLIYELSSSLGDFVWLEHSYNQPYNPQKQKLFEEEKQLYRLKSLLGEGANSSSSSSNNKKSKKEKRRDRKLKNKHLDKKQRKEKKKSKQTNIEKFEQKKSTPATLSKKEETERIDDNLENGSNESGDGIGTKIEQSEDLISETNTPNSTMDGSSINSENILSASGRSQRIRKKPKRWEDEELEVSFSGKIKVQKVQNNDVTTPKTAKNTVPNKDGDESAVAGKKRKSITKKESPEQKSSDQHDDDDDDKESEESSDEDVEENDDDSEKDSDFGSDDDPEKLWCICRQPYDERFMIGCDSCEEWFHGKCVNVTKVQGRKMEKLKQEWFCPSCSTGIKNGISREDLKKQAQERTREIEAKEAAERLTKKAKKKKKNEEKSKEKSSKEPSAKRRRSSLDQSAKSLKKTKDSRTNLKQEREEEEKRKLQKLIKASKKDLDQKKEKLLMNKTAIIKDNQNQNDSVSSEFENCQQQNDVSNSSSSSLNNSGLVSEEFSKVIVINKGCVSGSTGNKSLDGNSKKKHKSDLIDQSVQDLFKADSSKPTVLPRSLSNSSSTSSLSQSQQQSRKSSISTENDNNRRASTSSINNHDQQQTTAMVNCPATECGKPRGMANTVESIYCNMDCIQAHVTEAIKSLRQFMDQKAVANNLPKPSVLKMFVVDTVTQEKRMMLDSEVLDFICANPTFQIRKLNPKKMSNEKSSVTPATVTAKPRIKSSPEQKPNKHQSTTTTQETVSTTKKSGAVSPPVKPRERTPSVSSEKTDDNRRKFVRNSINEILTSRYNELPNSDNKSTISEAEIGSLAHKIEDELFKIFKNTNQKYNNKSRSLIFNLKDPKNSLYEKVLTGDITPERLVNMQAEEWAPTELAQWREHEKKNILQLITRDAVDQVNQTIVKKTHKGEELIESSSIITELPIGGELVEAITTGKNNDSSGKEDGGVVPQSIAIGSTTPELGRKDSVTSSTGNNGVEIPTETKSVDIIDIFSDTTAQHKTHIFSNNCKICTKKVANDEMKSNSKLSSEKSIPVDNSSSNNKDVQIVPTSPNDDSGETTTKGTTSSGVARSQPKRVSVELEYSKHFLKMFENNKNSGNDNAGKTETNTSSSSSGQNQKIVSNKSKMSDVMKEKSSSRNHKHHHDGDGKSPIWRGTISMIDVTNFTATAQVISGNISNIIKEDFPEEITVCGRIEPEHMLDYIMRLKSISAKRKCATEVGMVKFIPASKEERPGYEAFFNYLNGRHRYGVVGSSGRAFKDFYILPLSQSSDIPKVLLQTDTPVKIEKKNSRPNLLLGVLIRSVKSSGSSSSTTSKQSLPHSESSERSYTPPLSATPSYELTENGDDGSYTPPHGPKAITITTTSNKKSSKHSVIKSEAETTTDTVENLMEKVDSSTNSKAVLSAVVKSDNPESQKKLINQLNTKVENQMKNESGSDATVMNARTSSSGGTVSLDNLFSNIKNIQIPENLKDILKTVQEKSQIEPSPSGAIIENDTNNASSFNNQRLRMTANDTAPIQQQPVAASMSQDELLRKAQEQKAALAQMQQPMMLADNGGISGHDGGIYHHPSGPPPHHHHQQYHQQYDDLGPDGGSNCGRKISFQWKKKK